LVAESTHHNSRDIYWIDCPACGRFLITDEAGYLLKEPKIETARYILSAVARAASGRKQTTEFTTYTIPDLIKESKPPTTPMDVLDGLLIAIHDRTPTLTGTAKLAFKDFPLFFRGLAGPVSSSCLPAGAGPARR
jgi:hypothetical protein